ncbi:MAG: methyltransferase domain-containing protein [Actinomycetes bacterium]|jgi:SAM-dependent methyltransferase|nr:MAG: hypothetical protein DIU67_07160 [Actinomycetota bacterium]
MSFETLLSRLEELSGRPVESVMVDVDDFEHFKTLYVDDRPMIDDAKRFEYYVSYKYLGIGRGDVYIDIAAQDCPFAFFVADHFGATGYRQDLYYLEKGVHGNDIGGNAAEIPLPDGSVTHLALHNSFEHFEGRNDSRFVKEAQRLLAVGGKLLIVPLFIGMEYSITRNDGWVDDEGKKHLWGKGARFARWYDPDHFRKRVLRKAPKLEPRFFFVENAGKIHRHIYPVFVILERVA